MIPYTVLFYVIGLSVSFVQALTTGLIIDFKYFR